MSLFKKKSDRELDAELVRLEMLEQQRLLKEKKQRIREAKVKKINELRMKNTGTGKFIKSMQDLADKADKYYNKPIKKGKKGKPKPLFSNPFDNM